MDKEVKTYFDEYKKYSTISKKDVKEVELNSDSARHFRYDMFKFLEQLEDVVLEEKAGAEPIKASKIEDYFKVNKAIRELYKAADYNRAKAVEHAVKLSELPKTADIKAAMSKLTNLKKDIDIVLKSRDKKDKHRAEIEKLQKDIEADLKIMVECGQAVDKSPGGYRATKEFTKAIEEMMTKKPRLSEKTKKFMALAPKHLEKNILKKIEKECQDLEKDLRTAANKVELAGKARQSKLVIENVQLGYKHLQKLQGIVKIYSDIERKFGDYIDKSDDKKLIKDSIKDFKKILTDAEKLWDDAKTKV